MVRVSSFTGCYELSPEELVAIVEGKFTARKCLGCDGTGWLHFDGDGCVKGTGYKRDFDHEDPDHWVDSEGCDDCDGLGQIISLNI